MASIKKLGRWPHGPSKEEHLFTYETIPPGIYRLNKPNGNTIAKTQNAKILRPYFIIWINKETKEL